ncbi:MAG TPA: beta-ketoacyl synthase N-terminal-like domain-containing protein [Flavipsychrobacter sp.]|nr:beta-ketoacyl synthase N-terminal-like domain-containing protein [Flavipsychrobacter sp.]
MIPVYAIASNITSSLGITTATNWQAVAAGKIGVKRYEDASLSNTPFFASRIEPAVWQSIHQQTRSKNVLSPFEQLAIFSAKQALNECREELDLSQTIFILSTTKGNIEWLEQVPEERLRLSTSANIIARELGIAKAEVISHACVSGVVALMHAQRLLQAGKYKNAIVTGCDRFSRFVLNGFQSFQAIADEPCRPFDASRKGINLGEAAATIILSTKTDMPLAQIHSGSTSNDANHISGPSRTGEELALAIERALNEANINASQINMISAHGTATMYNDEMESKAFAASGLLQSPVHSFKGYIGHTLGAAGVVETAMIIEAIQRQQLIPSPGYSENGVSEQLNVTTQMQPAELNYVLKTASGFGGCNATLLIGKAN